VIKNKKVALDRLRVGQNVFLVTNILIRVTWRCRESTLQTTALVHQWMVSDIMRLHALRYDNVMSCQIVSTVCLHVFIIVLFSLASRTLLRYVRLIACAVHLSSVCLSVCRLSVCPSNVVAPYAQTWTLRQSDQLTTRNIDTQAWHRT